MEAPEKVYLHPDIGGREFIRPWLRNRANQESVEYVRTDAFIEKAAEWLEENLSEYCDGEDIEYTPSSTYNVTILQNERMIEDFKKAMML